MSMARTLRKKSNVGVRRMRAKFLPADPAFLSRDGNNNNTNTTNRSRIGMLILSALGGRIFSDGSARGVKIFFDSSCTQQISVHVTTVGLWIFYEI